jgi:hypothetical protein
MTSIFSVAEYVIGQGTNNKFAACFCLVPYLAHSPKRRWIPIESHENIIWNTVLFKNKNSWRTLGPGSAHARLETKMAYT